MNNKKTAQAQTLFQQATTFHKNGQLDQAQALYEKLLKLQPRHFDGLHLLGVLAYQTNRYQIAAELISKAIAVNPAVPASHSNIGLALQALKRPSDALIHYERAIALKPDYAEAHYNRGNALKELKRLDEAVASYDKATALKPDFAMVYNNCGNALRDLKRLDEAVASYSKAMALNPNAEFLFGILLHTKMMVCDWQGLAENLKNYEAAIRSSKKITHPFPVLALVDSPELHKQASKIYVDRMHPKSEQLGTIKKRAQGEKIRVGYYSADFHNHATAYLMAELFELHDAAKFEIFGFSYGPNHLDEMRQRVSSAFDHFFEVSDKSDLDIAQQSRQLGIDIAVDLKGFTTDARMGIFAERCAPIQVSYLGYPGTTAAEYIDYVIADKTVTPEQSQSDYTEKVAYLPNSYQVNDSSRRISERQFTRQELGLPESGFVFCCFNNNYKILPSTFDSWMRILKAVEGSVLWLLEGHPTAPINLRREAESRGVDSSRLIFAKQMPIDEHLARHKLADLFIDTLPYNAHTTASDALWAGLPVLTCTGNSFASRVAASLLNAIELPELITSAEADYEAKAIDLASNFEKLSEIKLKLEKNRLTTPLFDTRLFTAHIEMAYQKMHDRYQAGLAPESIEVEAEA